MTFLPYIAAYLLGALSFGAFMLWLLVKLHPKATPPTLHRRKNRDRPIPYIPPAWEREEGVDYKWLGITGMEE